MVYGDDFNMLLFLDDDRIGSSNVTIHGLVLAVWEGLYMHMRICDSWKHPSFVRKKENLTFLCLDSRIGDVNLSQF